MDLHADQIQGFFDVPVDHLYASTVFLDELKTRNLPNLLIATPDVGGTKRANTYAKYLNAPMVICYKLREKANEVSKMKIIGDVRGMDVVLVDDIVDTAGTITKAATLMMEEGAASVRALASHAVMSDPASTRVDKSPLSEIIFTDSIPYSKKSQKVKIVSVADMFAQAILRVCNNESISSLYVI
jgi:ribose-phosphate pyrophosphokinase